MKRAIVFLIALSIIAGFSGCINKKTEETGKTEIMFQLVNPKDGSLSETKVIKDKKEVSSIQAVLKSIEWTRAYPKMARYPDVEFWVHVEGAKVGNKYQFWYNSKVSNILSMAQGLGDISKEDARTLVKLLLSK
ncbi:hypothetical protein J5Y03_08510 [Bacillus sp. RG28]|uniref:Lipoprotein n=1 Tax=Gottfriedia endophytica TaxID=2820819 RepID=A0A940NQX0_9BACI|nr:hypothetical protein [Gottfriedia endophytica]MBP0725231.1 hypothetical protein [Gottfriedia endophytica]